MLCEFELPGGHRHVLFVENYAQIRLRCWRSLRCSAWAMAMDTVFTHISHATEFLQRYRDPFLFSEYDDLLCVEVNGR